MLHTSNARIASFQNKLSSRSLFSPSRLVGFCIANSIQFLTPLLMISIMNNGMKQCPRPRRPQVRWGHFSPSAENCRTTWFEMNEFRNPNITNKTSVLAAISHSKRVAHFLCQNVLDEITFCANSRQNWKAIMANETQIARRQWPEAEKFLLSDEWGDAISLSEQQPLRGWRETSEPIWCIASNLSSSFLTRFSTVMCFGAILKWQGGKLFAFPATYKHMKGNTSGGKSIEGKCIAEKMEERLAFVCDSRALKVMFL